MSEEKSVTQVDKEVRVNWLIFNVPQLVVLLGMVASSLGAYYTLLGRMDLIEQSRTERSIAADKRFTNIENSLVVLTAKSDRLPMIEQRTTALEIALVETNKRLDRFAELITNNIDGLKKDIASLTVEVKVSSDKLDRLLDDQPVKRTELFSPSRPSVH